MEKHLMPPINFQLVMIMVKVSEIMKTHVVTAAIDTDMSAIAKMMTNSRVGSIVIVEGDKPVEIVTTDDVVSTVSSGLDPKTTTIKDIHKRKGALMTISPDENILGVTKKMIKLGVKRFPVVDDKGRLVGIISEKEILLVAPELVEILSEKLKSKIIAVPNAPEITGVCEECGQYSEDLESIDGRWICGECDQNRD
jgi:CBS domain-containing protein